MIITFDQMATQWVNSASKLAVNAWNFEIKAGKTAVEVFRKSFDLKRLNSSGGKHWPARSPKSRSGHPLMVETGTLRNSITWNPTQNGVMIYTDPGKFGGAARHSGFCYAAVHNEGIGKIPQRQFIGDSTVLDNKLKEMIPTVIFKGLP